MSTPDEIEQMIADCEARESKLNDWERGFISDMADRVGNGRGLTVGQDEKLSEIWERIT